MNLRRWGALAAILAAGAFVGCEQSPVEKAQEEREEAVEAQQNALEETAEADAAARKAEQASGDSGGPALTVPAPTSDDSATPPGPEDATAPSDATDSPASEADRPTEPPDQPNEGDPQAGTQDAAP